MKRAMSWLLAVVMAVSLVPVMAIAAGNTAESSPMRVEQNEKVEQVIVGHQPITTYYYTLTMPYDGVMTVTGAITDAVYLDWAGLAGGMSNDRFNMGYDGPETMQHSLRKGDYTATIIVRNRSQDGFEGSFSFSYFVTPAIDPEWQGVPDAEPNDTYEDAIELAPDTVVTGNVNTQSYPTLDNVDTVDFYKFTVTQTAEVVLYRMCPTGGGDIWIAPADDDDIRYGARFDSSDGWERTISYTLEPGDYKIHVEGYGGTYVGDSMAYELYYKVLSGSVGGTVSQVTPDAAPGPNVSPNPAVTPIPVTSVDQPSDWAVEQVKEAIDLNLVSDEMQSGYANAATRAEFAALAVTLYETVMGREIATNKSIMFSDTMDINVYKAATIGVVNGVGDNKFDPEATLTREQAAAMLNRLTVAMEYNAAMTMEYILWSDEADISDYAKSAVQFVYKLGVMNGTGTGALVFSPQDPYTREQSIVTILRLYNTVMSQG